MSIDSSTSTVFALPEQARFSLVQVAFFVRLMAQITQPGTSASIHKPRIAPDAFGWCFANLSKEIDTILDSTFFSHDLVNAVGASEPSQHDG